MNPITRAMGDGPFHELRQLWESHPEIFVMDRSPSAEQLQAFYEPFRRTSYVDGLFRYGGLEKALKRLEASGSGAAATRAKPPPRSGPEEKARKDAKRREREVRFIRLLAELFGPCNPPPGADDWELPIGLFYPREQKRRREATAKSLRDAHNQLAGLLLDPYFKEGLKLFGAAECLLDLLGRLREAEGWIREAEPDYPFERVRDPDNARSRELITRLAYACDRIYAKCDETIIKDLTSYPWLAYVAALPDMKETIAQALGRKIEAYRRRRPLPKRAPVDTHGELLPASTLPPPWLRS